GNDRPLGGEPLQGTPRMTIAVVEVGGVDVLDDEELLQIRAKLVERAIGHVRGRQCSQLAGPEALGLAADFERLLRRGNAVGLPEEDGERGHLRVGCIGRLGRQGLEPRQRQGGPTQALQDDSSVEATRTRRPRVAGCLEMLRLHSNSSVEVARSIWAMATATSTMSSRKETA